MTVECAAHCLVKGKFTLSALGALSLDHILTGYVVLERTHIYSIVSDYLSATDMENLNKSRKAFTHFHRMIFREKYNIVFKLFQYDPHCMSQTYVHIESRLQFIFITVMHRLHVLSIMRYLDENCTASCLDPDKIIKECKEALPSELLVQIKWGLHDHNRQRP